MCTNNLNEECKCIAHILKTILILQRSICPETRDLETCDRPKFGHKENNKDLNTRPIHLFLCCKNGNEPLEMPLDNEPIRPSTKFSNVFRIEKLDECCATFRVLDLKPGSEIVYEATDSFFTLDLKCVCIIKCLDDAFVEGL